MAVKIPSSPSFKVDKIKPKLNKPFLVKTYLGHQFNQQRTTSNESRGITMWVKRLNERVCKKDTWLSILASKGRAKGKYDPVTKKYKFKDKGMVWTLGERDANPAPFSIPFDAAWISQDIPVIVDMSPLLHRQTFIHLDSSHKEKWKEVSIAAFQIIVKYNTIVDPNSENSVLRTLIQAWIRTVLKQAKEIV
jgi:hypothetical protein